MKKLKIKGRIDIASFEYFGLAHNYMKSNTMDLSTVIFLCSDALELIIERLINNLDTILSTEVIELIIKSYKS